MRRHISLSVLVPIASLLGLFSVEAQAAYSVTSATALPATVAPGASVTLAVPVKSTTATSNAIVDLELYNAAGVRVAQNYYQGQSFTANQTRSYSWSYAIPVGTALGAYHLMVGVFTANWASDVYWNGSAASFSIKGAATNGACGTSSGATLSTIPTANLCKTGTASGVSGSGPWNWSCAGTNGGTTAMCTAGVAATAGGGTAPTGLPGTLFVGLAAQPTQLSSWVKASGIPWAMCYQYISSGVTPGKSWVTTWGTNFAYNYAVSAHTAGCIPEFTYYQMVPTIGAEGSAAESAALANATTMANYYSDFTALLKQLKQYGGTAVVHVEPDMFGYLEQLNGNPALLAAAVASSNNADVAGYPNTVAGFGQALLHLRDLYAPNVIMAAHVSTWNWSLSTSASLNVTTIAQQNATFMTGLGNWDLFFTDISDRDAGYYQYAEGDGGAHWWDLTNQKYPNFNRLNTWAAAFTTASGKRLVIWQIPIGNTLMDTENNKNWHYQDNREQYWLQNYPTNTAMSALAKAGVIGLLFGSGASDNSSNFDSAGDGITNPAPINGNSEVSSYSDDDGGLLRLNVGNYYRSGAVPLP
jgi:hypothetical protein